MPTPRPSVSRLSAPPALALLAALLALPGPAAAQSARVPICSTRDAAQMLTQAPAPGARLPEGCRFATVRRLDTPAGPLCQIDVAPNDGLVGAVQDAVANTEWWTACTNLRAP